MNRLWDAWDNYPFEILFSCLVFSLIPWLVYRLKVQPQMTRCLVLEDKISILEEELAAYKKKEQEILMDTVVVSKMDDLKIVEGIGPKIETLCREWGIYTFQELADTPVDFLRHKLAQAGPRFQMHDPTTWPDQARLASEGRWDELKIWQDQLHKGKQLNP